MATVTLNGVTYTDDSDPTTGLANGGHRTRLIPMFGNAVIDLAAKAALATTNGATQASLATTNGATQVSLATTQANLAAADRVQTGLDRIATAADAASTAADVVSTAADVVSTAAMLDEFGDQYLGVKTADPTLDNDGNALIAGAFYFNSITAVLRAYTGSAWVQGIGSTAGVASVNGLTGTVTNIAVTGANTFTAAQEWPTGTAIASAATINLNTATGNRVHVTGTNTITAVTLTRGPRTVIFDGILTLTHHATNNNLPGAVNIITAAGDRATYESDGTTVYCVSYVKANGGAVSTIGSTPDFILHSFNIT